MTSEVSDTSLVGTPSGRRFLGWQILAVGCAAQFIASGVSLSIVGNVIGPISESFDVSPSLIGIAPGIAILVIGFFGIFVGRMLDRGWARRLMTAGSMLTGIGLILISKSTELWELAAAWTLFVCPGVAMFGMLPSMTLASNWFERRRGLALGIVVGGATLASWIAPASLQAIIDSADWRTAVLYFGVFTCVVSVPLFGTLVVGRPEDIGQLPDGDVAMPPSAEDAEATDEQAEEIGSEIKLPAEIVRDPRLWLASIGFGLVLTSPVVLIALLVPFGVSLGFTGQEATAFFLAMVPFSLAGKVVIGGLADVAPLKPSIIMIVVVNILVWLILLTEPSYTVFLATGALYGIGIGGASPVHGVLVARLFGRVNFGTASGLGGIASIPLLASANFLSMAMLKATGSYAAPFTLQIGLLVLGGILLAILRIPAPPDSAR